MGLRISAGNLDQSITIQKLTTAQDGMGGETQSWATAIGSPTFAQYMTLRGMERIEAGKLESVTEFKLRIRRWATLDTSYRITHGGKTYRITGIEDNHRQGDMVVHCAEVV